MSVETESKSKILAVDPGDARIGIAVSDQSAKLARPLCILTHVSRPENAARIAALADEEGCRLIIVGTPYDSDGEVGPRARASLKLIQAIQDVSQIEVIAWDESHSSQKAEQAQLLSGVSRKKRRQPKDDLAAAILLQDFLDQAGSQEKHAA